MHGSWCSYRASYVIIYVEREARAHGPQSPSNMKGATYHD